MSLNDALQKAKSEEDVKDAYIKAIGLKGFNKNLVDIQSEEIWFEAKEAPTAPAAMFAQLLYYIRDAHKKGEPIPAFLGVFDREKAALMETKNALPLLKDKTIVWPKNASAVSKECVQQIHPYIETHFVVYKIETHEPEFLQAVKTAIKEGKFIRTNITPDNLKQVFDKWVEMVGKEIEGVDEVDFALLFFADIMSDGKQTAMADLPARLLHDGDKPVFMRGAKVYELASVAGYRRFWSIYHRPPEEQHRGYLLERRDSLLPIDERSFKGAYYTPLNVVDKAYDLLSETLGKNWQKNYVVWDMCCGVGNLEVKHSNHRNVFMSTLDTADIDVMRASRTCAAATHFQYDYLNDDITDHGEIDYSLTNKIPKALRLAIAEGKKLLVLINPPYAEAPSSIGNEGKTDVAKTNIGAIMNQSGYGYAARELFVQFMARIQKEMPNATLAMFSTLKYVNAPNFEEFRQRWQAKYLGGFVVHSKAFDGLAGNFPIGFLVWQTTNIKIPLQNEGVARSDGVVKTASSASSAITTPPYGHPFKMKGNKITTLITEITTAAIDRKGQWIGVKSFYNIPNKTFLSEWLPRLKKSDVDAIPLINAITPITKTEHVRNTKWSNNAIGHFFCNGNDLQNSGTMTALFSSVHSIGHAGGYFVTAENLWQAAIIFSVRRLIKPTWLNDRDQFLQPSAPLTDEFKHDCLIWMLFNGSNLSASANGLEWNDKTWSIVNHFIPFTELEVNAKGRFESAFMSDYLKGKTLSPAAKAVMVAGRAIWTTYFTTDFERKVREEYKLNRPDVGWYQIRKALETNGKTYGTPFDFSDFKTAYEALSEKLRPQVFELGFLKN